MEQQNIKKKKEPFESFSSELHLWFIIPYKLYFSNQFLHILSKKVVWFIAISMQKVWEVSRIQS